MLFLVLFVLVAVLVVVLAAVVTVIGRCVGNKVRRAVGTKDLSTQSAMMSPSKDGKGQITCIALLAQFVRHPVLTIRRQDSPFGWFITGYVQG